MIKLSRPCYKIEDFNDIEIIVDHIYFKANKCLLTARSPYFQLLFSSNFLENSLKRIRILWISYQSLFLVLQYIYTDKVSLQPISKSYKMPFLLLIAADYFILPRLVDICSEEIAQLISMSLATSIMLFAYVYNSSKLLNLAAYYIAYQ